MTWEERHWHATIDQNAQPTATMELVLDLRKPLPKRGAK